MAQTTPPPTANSLAALWASHADGNSLDVACNVGEVACKDVATFASALEPTLKDWAALFTQVPSDHKRRKEALAGAVKIKNAMKRFEKLNSPPAGDKADGEETKTDAVATQDASAGEMALASQLKDSLVECQQGFRDSLLGLLDVSFPVEEAMANEDFDDAAAITAAIERANIVIEKTNLLAQLFDAAKVDPKPTAGTSHQVDSSLEPQIIEMMRKAKKKEKKGVGVEGATVMSTADLNAIKAEWEQTFDGRCSKVLGEELWEGVCWRRGIFIFTHISNLLSKHESQSKEDQAEKGSVAPVPRELFAAAAQSFWSMLYAQGPLPGDRDDPVQWRLASDGPHEDETARLFYHGVYSSSHLRGLKYLCELYYWQWKHLGKTKRDAELAAMLNKKFTHVVRQIMPAAGWTADVEYDRIVEMEKETLETSTFSAGLNEMPKVKGGNPKRIQGGYQSAAPASEQPPVAAESAAGTGSTSQRKKKSSQKK